MKVSLLLVTFSALASGLPIGSPPGASSDKLQARNPAHGVFRSMLTKNFNVGHLEHISVVEIVERAGWQQRPRPRPPVQGFRVRYGPYRGFYKKKRSDETSAKLRARSEDDKSGWLYKYFLDTLAAASKLAGRPESAAEPDPGGGGRVINSTTPIDTATTTTATYTHLTPPTMPASPVARVPTVTAPINIPPTKVPAFQDRVEAPTVTVTATQVLLPSATAPPESQYSGDGKTKDRGANDSVRRPYYAKRMVNQDTVVGSGSDVFQHDDVECGELEGGEEDESSEGKTGYIDQISEEAARFYNLRNTQSNLEGLSQFLKRQKKPDITKIRQTNDLNFSHCILD